MRICLDARQWRGTVSGLGRYAVNLVRQLAALDHQNEYIVLLHASRHEALVTQPNFTEIRLPYKISSARNTLWGARPINSLQADIYHALFHFLPLGVQAGHVVITLHDLIWVEHPELSFESRWRQWWKCSLAAACIRHAVARADHVIAISENTLRMALAHYGTPMGKFTLCYQGADPVFFAPAPDAPLPRAVAGRRFVFCMGNTKPYKNTPRLLQAFGRIAPEYPDLLLLIVGRGDGFPSLMKSAGSLGLTERVVFSQQLSDAQVRVCFDQAVFFAFPSLVEGFGLPVVEAMASGCPVLTSWVSSLGEIAGDAAVLVDPEQVEAIAAGMRRLLTDEPLRCDLVQRGRQRAAEFTWSACAARTLAVYDALASRAGDPCAEQHG